MKARYEQIITLMSDVDAKEWTASELANLLEKKPATIRKYLAEMVKEELVRRSTGDNHVVQFSLPPVKEPQPVRRGGKRPDLAEKLLAELQSAGYNARVAANGAVAVRGLQALTYIRATETGYAVGSNIQGRNGRQVGEYWDTLHVPTKCNRRDEYTDGLVTKEKVLKFLEMMTKG